MSPLIMKEKPAYADPDTVAGGFQTAGERVILIEDSYENMMRLLLE